MADVNSNININFNTAAALAQLRSLQAGLSRFHQSLAEGNLAAANAQKGLNAQLLQSIGATGKFSASQVKVAGSTLAFTSALEKNKLSLREYYRYTMAAATANTRVMGKAFAQEREIINRARRDRVKALQAQYIQMNKSNAGFMDAIKIMPKSLAMANGKFTELGTRIQYAAQRQQLLNQLLKQGSTQLLNFGKNTQWAGRQLMVGLTMPLALFGASAAKTFRDLETEIVKFRRVYGNAFTNDAETDAAVENIRKLATEYTKYGVSVTKTMEMAATAAAAGFTGSALNAQVETATKLAVLGQVEQQQALETTISLQSAFGLSSEELAKKINFLNAVENQTLLSIEDLTIAIPKAAPVIKQLGGSVEDLAFFLTAMKEGGINASEGANALKSGLASLINPSDKAAKFMGNLGINIKGLVEANKGDIKGIVVGFAQALDTLDPLNRARAIEQMFGKFQFARLSTLFQNVTKDGSQASRAFDLAGASIEELAVLSEREMKKIEDSVGVKFQAAVEQFKQDIMPLGKIFLEALTPVVKFFGSLFEKFNGLSDNTKKVIAVVVGAVAGLGPIVLMTFGLLANGIANVIKFFAMLRGGIARLNGQTSVMGAGFNYMTQEQIENAASSQSLHQTHTRLIEVFNVEANSVNALASSYNSLSTQMRSMASQNPALFAGGMAGAKSSVSKLPPVRKYKDGILTVPGPKGAGDIQPAMLAPGEAVIPAKTTDKYRGLISAMFNDKVPGFMAGRIPAGRAMYSTNDLIMQKVKRPAYPGTHPERQSGPTFVGMPKTFEEASQSRQMLDKISQRVSIGRFGTMPPSNFGTKLTAFKGYSFPDTSIGGVYRKPNGELVVVKPTISAETALADIRMAEIEAARGSVVPKQKIRTMIDPTDPTEQRKFIVLESPYDARFANMDGKFSQGDMIKQLVGSTLRGDKDLQRSNVSGNRVPDVSNAGVFNRASGFREYADAMPSMEKQAMINLLGVKGGARKDFALATADIAKKMSPKDYAAAIKREINESIPIVERLIKSWDLNAEEKIVYGKMLERLKAGAKVKWEKFQPIHARAGEGVIKAKKGIGSGATDAETTEQQSKYQTAILRNKSRTQIDRLVRKLNKDTRKALIELKKTNPEQHKKAIDILKQSKAFKANGRIDLRQSKVYRDFISKDLVYQDGAYHTTKAIEKGQSPTTSAKSYDVIKNQMLYRMGVAPKPGKESFSNKAFNASRLHEDLTSTTQSGGWRANIDRKSDLYKALDKAELEHKTRNIQNPKNVALNNLRTQMLADKYTPKQVEAMLRTELSHISKTGEAGLGPQKWKTGFAKFDLRLLNSYVNPGGKAGKPVENPRLQKILDWDAKNKNVLFNSAETAELKKALDFMKTGAHPITESQARLVQAAANAQVHANNYLNDYEEKNPGKRPKGFPRLGSVKQAKAVSMLLDYRLGSGYYQGTPTIYSLTPGSTVLAQPGEYLADLENRTAEKLSVGNTQSRPMGATPSTKKVSDNLAVEETQTKRVITQNQAKRGGFKMPGRDKGDPELSKAAQGRVTNAMQKQVKLLKERNNLTQKEINQALTQYRTRLIAAEVEKRNQQAKQKAMADEKRQREQLSQTAKENARKADAQAKADAKEAVKEKRMARQQKIGGVSGGLSMGLGMAGSAAMMTGNMGVGMGLMGASAVAGLAPMLAGMGPIGWVTTAALALGGGLYLLNRNLENSAKAQAKYIDSVSATTEKMDEIGQITNKVGASRAMDEVRKKGNFGAYNDVERAGTSFGNTFLRSEVGKSMSAGFVDQMKRSDSATAAQDFALQLATYVSDGVLDASQAASIADQIGIQLGSRKYTAEIMGNLRSIIGPNGEDLAKDPLRVRTRIVEEANRRSNKIVNSGKIGRTEAAQLGALAVNNVSIAKAQADATEFQYRKQIQLLEKELESTTNAEKLLSIKEKLAALEGRQATDVAAANKNYADQIDKEVDRYKKTAGVSRFLYQDASGTRYAGDDFAQMWSSPTAALPAYSTSLKSKITNKYKDTDFADTTTEVLGNLDDLGGQGFSGPVQQQDFKLRMSLMLADGTLNPEQLKTFMAMFQGNLPELQETLSIGMRTHGPGATVELLEYFSGFEDGDGKVKEIATKIVNQSNPAQFKEIGETLAVLRALDGDEINMEAYIKTVGYDGIIKLSKDLAKIEAMPKKIDKELILKYFATGGGVGVAGTSKENLETLFAQWKDFDKLPDKAQKEAISKFTAIYSTLFTDEASRLEYAKKEALKTKNIAGLGNAMSEGRKQQIMSGSVEEARVLEAARGSKDYVGENGEFLTNSLGGANGPSSGSGADPLAFLGPLAMGLKQVRDGAFDALNPVESLLQALRDKKTQTGAFRLFDGIQDRLEKLGLEQGFRDAISSMSADEFKKISELTGKDAIFTFEKGKSKTKDTITGLTTTGQGINQGYEALLEGNRRDRVRQKANLANDDFAMYKDMPKLVSAMKELNYSSDQINEALADPEMAKFLVDDLADGKLDAEFIAKYLNNIEEKKVIDIQVKSNLGDLKGLAEPGLNIVDELFAAQEGLINTGKNAMDIIANDIKISDLDLQILPFNKQIKDLSSYVDILNRQLEMNPLFGDRAIQTIQDENSSLSNDLTVISKAAEEVNKKYDDQAEALQKVSDINEDILNQQKRQIDLADAITSGDISAAATAVQEIRAANAARFADAQSKALEQARENELGALTGPKSGLNQEQINAKMYENSKKIYEMETNPERLAIVKNIRDNQDAIYKIEKEKIGPLQEQIDKLVYSNTLLQDVVDKEKANVTVLGQTKLAWDAITASITAYDAARKGLAGSKDLEALFIATDKTKAGSGNTDKTIKDFATKTPAQIIAENAARALQEQKDRDLIFSISPPGMSILDWVYEYDALTVSV